MRMSQTILVAIFTASLIAANLLGSKLIDIYGVTVSMGIFVFPFTFVSLDIMTEIYGTKSAQRTVVAGILTQLYVLGFVYLGHVLPTSASRNLGNAYDTMFALAPRMVLASVVAYSLSQVFDVFLFAKLKADFPNHPLILRTNLSSWTARLIDTAIFSGVFLGSVLGFSVWWKSFIFGYVTKMVVSTFDSPFVNLGVWLIHKLEPADEK